MKHSKLLVGLAVAGSIGFATIAYAAGLWPDLPVVGSASYCAGNSSSATGTIIGLVTGCPNTVPAGPTIVTGNEQIPADTRLASGVAPQTVLLPMASLNALPITFSTLLAGSNAYSITSTNTSGGVAVIGPATITQATVWLPTAPIDGQQFKLASNFTITALIVTPTSPAVVSNSPTALTISTTAPYNYLFAYHAANTTWYRLQ